MRNTEGKDTRYDVPGTLDLFALETKSRRTIAELMQPIVAEISEDRRKVASVTSTQDRIKERLSQLEYALGLSEKRPQIFEDFDDKIADNKMQMAQNHNDMEFRTDVCDQEIDRIKINLNKVLVEMKGIESLT